jgi:ADP-ribosyl-[dinitrogen reductase] hydrolase
VVRTLEAALWAFYKTDTFRDGALMVVNLGDDADTTGAVYGQIAGAYYGITEIPQPWLDKIAMGECIHWQANKLYRLSMEPNL